MADGTWPAEFHQGIESFVKHVARHNGLLVERAPERWAFLHQTFQEFYVARWMLTREPARTIRSVLHDPRYREPILLALGIATHVDARDDSADIFEAAILGTGTLSEVDPTFFAIAEYEDLIHRDRDFALRAACDDVRIPPTRIDDLANEFAEQLTDMPFGRNSMPSVGTDFSKAIVLALRKRLEGGSGDNRFLRQWAAVALGQLGDTSDATLSALREIATDTGDDSSVRQWVCLLYTSPSPRDS